MVIKGITKRWLFSSLSLMLFVLIATAFLFSLVAKSYCYSKISRVVNEKSNEFIDSLNRDKPDSSSKFEKETREYVQNFKYKELMELMIFNDKDEIVITSTGFKPQQNENMPDYNNAKSSSSNYAVWTGKLLSEEKVMAVTRCVYADSGEYLGSIRYVVSLESANKNIILLIVILSIAGILFMAIVVFYSSFFIKAIVDPLHNIGRTANMIAEGNFNVRVNKKHDDEIGEFCDIINYMAGELGTSEKLKNDFISSVSHELRTPLTAIKGWAETMQIGDSMDKATMVKGLKIIVSESERLSGIVEELLDFSRMQSGRIVLTMDKIDLLAEIDEAVYIFKNKAKSENKELVYDAPATIPPVLGDRNRLKQVFINIIDNAIKYTQNDGSVLVQVVEEEVHIRITITDNGCGIPKDDLPKVKEKFYKANMTQRGSGIGLAVADEIVSLHSGFLDISSQEGIGTVVTVSIPKMKGEVM